MTGEHVFHTARFGNRRGAHDILYDTGAPYAVLNTIKWYTDRSSARWDDAVGRTCSGYLLAGHYVVQATTPDLDAGRGGMVKTTAVLIPEDRLSDVDLGSALAAVDVQVEADSLDPVPAAALRRSQPCPHAPGVAALATALASTGLAVWSGPGAQEALACLWRHLSDDDRGRLAFAATDHPGIAALPRRDDGIRVLVVPHPPPGPFAGLPVVGVRSGADDGPFAALLDPDSHPASVLASRLGLVRPTLRQWLQLTGLHGELRSIQGTSLDQCLGVLALLGLLAPEPATGSALKHEALARLGVLVAGRPYVAVRTLRTVPWRALGTQDDCTPIVAGWVLRATAERDARSIADALQELRRRGEGWFPQLYEEIRTAVAVVAVAAFVMAELFRRPDGQDAVVLVPTDGFDAAAFDRALAESLGAAPQERWAAGHTLEHRWPRSHAAVVDTSDPVSAWQAHLVIATGSSAKVLAGRITGADNVRAAVGTPHPLLVELAGRLVADDPSLLTPPRPDTPAYREVWAAAVRRGMAASACCPPEVAALALVDAVLEGEEIDEVLLVPFQDEAGRLLAGHRSAGRLWDMPVSDVVLGLRASTAAAVARSLRPGGHPPPSRIAGEILDGPVLLSLARSEPAQAVTVVEVLEDLAGERHGTLLARNTAGLAPEDADRLGAIVQRRRWHATARFVARSGRADLTPAMPHVADLLGFFDKLWLFLEERSGSIPEPTEDEVHGACLDLLAKLYPQGPSSELWELSGGAGAKRPTQPTGWHAWQLALEAISHGAADTPTLPRLLTAAADEHPNNQQLDVLRQHVAGMRNWRKQ